MRANSLMTKRKIKKRCQNKIELAAPCCRSTAKVAILNSIWTRPNQLITKDAEITLTFDLLSRFSFGTKFIFNGRLIPLSTNPINSFIKILTKFPLNPYHKKNLLPQCFKNSKALGLNRGKMSGTLIENRSVSKEKHRLNLLWKKNTTEMAGVFLRQCMRNVTLSVNEWSLNPVHPSIELAKPLSLLFSLRVSFNP